MHSLLARKLTGPRSSFTSTYMQLDRMDEVTSFIMRSLNPSSHRAHAIISAGINDVCMDGVIT